MAIDLDYSLRALGGDDTFHIVELDDKGKPLEQYKGKAAEWQPATGGIYFRAPRLEICRTIDFENQTNGHRYFKKDGESRGSFLGESREPPAFDDDIRIRAPLFSIFGSGHREEVRDSPGDKYSFFGLSTDISPVMDLIIRPISQGDEEDNLESCKFWCRYPDDYNDYHWSPGYLRTEFVLTKDRFNSLCDEISKASDSLALYVDLWNPAGIYEVPSYVPRSRFRPSTLKILTQQSVPHIEADDDFVYDLSQEPFGTVQGSRLRLQRGLGSESVIFGTPPMEGFWFDRPSKEEIDLLEDQPVTTEQKIADLLVLQNKQLLRIRNSLGLLILLGAVALALQYLR